MNINDLKHARIQLDESKSILASAIVGSDQLTLNSFNSFLLSLGKYERLMESFLDEILSLNESLRIENEALDVRNQDLLMMVNKDNSSSGFSLPNSMLYEDS